MDLSAVKLYENRAVGEAGAEAVAKGSNIAFAPGKLDFSSTRGQALLGHEISHVASQAKGEVKGSGLVNDSALEARADAEGMKAARGESIASDYGGAVAPLSDASAASAAGPMQAKSGKKKNNKNKNKNKKKKKEKEKEKVKELTPQEMVDKMFRLSAAKMRQDLEYDQAFENKKQELLNNGLTDESAEQEAEGKIKKEDYLYLDEKEEKWLQDMYDNPTLDIAREITDRQQALGEKIYNGRMERGKKSPNEDKGKLDLETRFSSEATDYTVYDYMMNNFNSEKKGAITNQLDEERRSNFSSFSRNFDAENYMLDLVSGDFEDKSKNKYLNTEDGQKMLPYLYKLQNTLLGAASGIPKHLKRNKK